MSNPQKELLKKQLVAAVFAKDKLGMINAAKNITEHGFKLEDLDLSPGFYKVMAKAIQELGMARKP